MNKVLCCKKVQVCSVFHVNAAQQNICQINSCHTVCLCPHTQVNYYGPIKPAGIVSVNWGRRTTRNSEVGQKIPRPLTPLCFCSYAGCVGSAFENERSNPEASVRNTDPVLKGVKLRMEQLTQVQNPAWFSFSYAPRTATRHIYSTIITHIYFCGLATFHIWLHFHPDWYFDLLSDPMSMVCFPEADSYYAIGYSPTFPRTLPAAPIYLIDRNLMARETKVTVFLHSFFTPMDIFHFRPWADARRSSAGITVAARTLAPVMLINAPSTSVNSITWP